MKNAGFLISVALVMFVVYFSFSNSSFLKNTNNTFEVIIDDSGFTPDNMTVPVGATITWVNKGNRLHWPASNNHPTHGVYPESGGCIGSKFDACKGLSKGESFSFVLDDVGSWGVHDHLFPGLVMAVNVVSLDDYKNKNYKTPKQEEILPKDFRTADYGRQLSFIKSLAKKDPSAAWKYLKQAFIVNGEVVGNAHEFAHIVGNISYDISGMSGVKICDDSFAFGCFHGVTEQMIAKEGLSKVRTVQTECLKAFPPGETQDYTGCIHGTGHGLYTFEEGDVKAALSDCDVLDESYRQYCYDGVFMENADTPSSIDFDPNDPWKFCSDLDSKYHRNCARYQWQVFSLNSKGGDLSIIGGYCAKGRTLLLRNTCFESLGYNVAQKSNGVEYDIWQNCSLMPTKEGQEICVVGGATESEFQRYIGYETTRKNLCNRLSKENKEKCLSNNTFHATNQ